MSEFMGRLFGLSELDLSDPSVRFELVREWAPWVWAFFLLAAIGFSAWSYWKLIGGKAARVVLATLRTLTLVALLVMLAGPQLVKQSERTEKDWVVVLVDRSASMSIADAPGATADTYATREEQLRGALRSGDPAWQSIRADRNILFLAFDAGAYDLAQQTVPGDLPVVLAEPVGRRTSIGRSIEQALRRVASRPVAGVVLLSDGRSDEAITRPLLRQIEARQVPVFAVALGSASPIPDFAVAQVEAPPGAFKGDLVPVSVEVEGRGLGEAAQGAEVKVELVDTVTGEVLAETTTSVREGAASRVLLTSKAEREGTASWTVRVTPPGRDISAENNSQVVAIEVADRAIRVVYFDGYPRWEYRYLKNILVREPSIKSSALLVAGDKRFIQEGSDPLTTIPRTAEEWAPFDVIVMGDVRSALFGEEQLRQIRDQVARKGAGLLWIAGAGSTPTGWFGGPLADLIPFTRAGGAASDSLGMPVWLKPVVITPALAADRYAVLRLGTGASDPWPVEVMDPQAEWSSLRWAQRIENGTLKPTAEVLANAVAGDPLSADAESLPLVVTMRYGAGRIVYVATDEIWRLRYGKGDALPERFYVPLLRLLARDSLGRTGKPAIVEVTPSAALVDQRVTVTLRVLDEALVASKPDTIKVKVTSASGERELDLRPDQSIEGESPTVFSGVFVPSEPGTYSVSIVDAAFAGLGLGGSFVATYAQDELKDPRTDHPLLASLTDASGGRMLTAGQLADLPRLLPNRQVRIVGAAQVETLWDKPIVWVLLMVLLGAEWIGRRVIRLS